MQHINTIDNTHLSYNTNQICFLLASLYDCAKKNMQTLEVPCPSYLLYNRGSKDYGCNLHTRDTSNILSRDYIMYLYRIISDCRMSVVGCLQFLLYYNMLLTIFNVYSITLTIQLTLFRCYLEKIIIFIIFIINK